MNKLKTMFEEQSFRNEAEKLAKTLKYDNDDFKPELLSKWDENQVKDFIRERLRIIEPETIGNHFRCKGSTEDYITFFEILKKQHKRFEMSGFENKTGECVVTTQEILNRFADLGIYNYVTYLYLDFWKGVPMLFLQYWGDVENQEHDLGGYGTVDIIYEIFKLTILNNKDLRTRRRE